MHQIDSSEDTVDAQEPWFAYDPEMIFEFERVLNASIKSKAETQLQPQIGRLTQKVASPVDNADFENCYDTLCVVREKKLCKHTMCSSDSFIG